MHLLSVLPLLVQYVLWGHATAFSVPRYLSLPREPRRTFVSGGGGGNTVSLRAVNEEGEPAPPDLPDGRTVSGLAEMLEVTFVKACMQLSQGYVDTLKLFVASGVAAYAQGFTVKSLQLELAQVSTSTAGRPLSREEVDLRTLWLCLVFLTCEQLQHPTSGDPAAVGASVPPEIRQEFNRFTYDVVNARRGGWTFQTLKLEDVMRRSGTEAAAMTDIERAILSQSMRLVFLTMTVIDEEKLAGGDSVPKPNIPGA